MGGAKRMIEEREDRRSTAIAIAVEAGALEECDHHDGTFFDGGGSVEEAIKLGEEQFSEGEHGDLFDSKQDLVDLIQRVVEELADPEGCPECAHRFGDD
ncbi:hypothetical protein P3W55_08285 [Pseudomonas citronellolis]|uniref:DksA C4-type domain-containing protein n=1 Tax=Pseudomonas citronellolis TaxID=53408 RepID=A0AAW6P6C4_9PSED|nr:hypothetical protein [Pseudomonas citronellolis]MDF3841709.1 hypothetical protein [Pseudomonas citronellolis]